MLEPEIIYENLEMVVINKPAGLLVHHTSHNRQEPTLTDWLIERYPEIQKVGDDPNMRPGIVHRLDKETSGVLVVAKTQTEFLRLKSLFAGRAIRKTYYALLSGILKPQKGEINLPISLKDGSIKRTVGKGKMTKVAVTNYETIHCYADARGERYSLAMLRPETGRTHQLRVHCSAKGAPIVGDNLYGKSNKNLSHKDGGVRLMLHSFALELPDGSGGRLRLEAGLPQDFELTIKDLKEESCPVDV